MTNATRPKTGFTLIELLVVLAVVTAWRTQQITDFVAPLLN